MSSPPSVLVVTSRDLARTVRVGLRQLGAGGIAVLTPAGLSCDGWVHDPHDPSHDTVVIGGNALPVDRIDRIIAALDYVEPYDLPHIHPEDQLFVAQEMTAFLRSWLAARTGLVLDRPTPSYLSGPAGDPDRWLSAIREVGVIDRRRSPAASGRVERVTIVAGQVVGTIAAPYSSIALALVEAAGIPAADLRFRRVGDGVALVAAGPWWLRPAPDALRAVLNCGSAVGSPGSLAQPS